MLSFNQSFRHSCSLVAIQAFFKFVSKFSENLKMSSNFHLDALIKMTTKIFSFFILILFRILSFFIIILNNFFFNLCTIFASLYNTLMSKNGKEKI